MDASRASADAALVEIVRDFLRAHRELRAIAALHRSGELHFERVKGLVGDGEEAVLFRLKERCHKLFRERGRRPGRAARRSSISRSARCSTRR